MFLHSDLLQIHVFPQSWPTCLGKILEDMSVKFSICSYLQKSTRFAKTYNLRGSRDLRAADPSVLMEKDKFQPEKERTDNRRTIDDGRQSQTPAYETLSKLGRG